MRTAFKRQGKNESFRSVLAIVYFRLTIDDFIFNIKLKVAQKAIGKYYAYKSIKQFTINIGLFKC